MDTTHQRLAGLAGTRNHNDLPHGCACGKRWSGAITCHCGAANCHQTFSGEGTYSRHRRGGECLDPATLGMGLLDGRAYQVWGTPSTEVGGNE